MEVFRKLPSPASRPLCGLAIGNFDGVHLGHQAIVRQLREAAGGLPVNVLTFEPHPREYFSSRFGGQAPARVCTERDKLDALRDAGVDGVVIAEFDSGLAGMAADAFIKDIICERLNTRHLLVGDDFRFGAHRTGDHALLTDWAARGAFALHQMPTLTRQGARISSSLVRTALAQGDFDTTAQLLGRPYMISGEVAHGAKLGRTLGFPTLNIDLPFAQPALTGIFVVEVHGLQPQALPAVASLGVRPAVESDGQYKLEVHLFDFSRDVYGQFVRVEFLKKLRDEAPYDTLDALKAQISIDSQQARDFFS